MSSTKNNKPKEEKIFSRGGDDETFCRPKKYTFWRIFWGLFFIAAAGTVILSALNTLAFDINIGWLFLGVFLVATFLYSIFKLQWFGVFLSAAGVATILAKNIDVIDSSGSAIGAIWATAVLLSIGFSVLFRSRNKSHRCNSYGHSQVDRKYERVIDSEDDSEIFVEVNFGSTVKYVNTKKFQHATIKSNFGSITAYFDNADIDGDKATIDIDGSFSGIELYIPKTWHVINSINCNLAGIDEKNSPRLPQNPKTVILAGTLNLAGIEIIYV